jgi:sugar (pentulose or hexulose) kinase
MTARREALIGLDIGTTAVKALAFEPGRVVLGGKSTPKPTQGARAQRNSSERDAPHPGGRVRSETDRCRAAAGDLRNRS